jgi:HEAT repeat protein
MSASLSSPDAHERSSAVTALSRATDHAKAVATLAAIVRQDPDRGVRIDATVALGRLGGPDATALLVEKALSADESIVRVAALEAIETTRDPTAVPGLFGLFRLERGQDDVVAQIGARQALLKIGTRGVPQLLQGLSDSSPKVRAAAVEVLGQLGDRQVTDRIASLQTDPDPGVRRAVSGALVALGAPPR